MDQDTMTVAPKLRTKDVTTARRMFFRCYGLTEVPQYDWRNLLDGQSMFEEASAIETIPFMNTDNMTSAERMFYGATSLRQSPEMSLRSATTMKDMFYGCLNLVRVNPFGSTKNVTDMTRAFSGDDALEKIDSPIDFSSITDASALTDIFKDCIELNKLYVVENTLSVSLDVSNTNLSIESLNSVFEGLAKYTGNSVNAPTLDIRGIDATIDLTGKDKAIVFNKGWNLAEDSTHYEASSVEDLENAIATAVSGETVFLNTELNTVGTPIQVVTDDVSIVMSKDIVTDGGNASGINVSDGSLTLSGDGLLVNNTAAASGNMSGVARVTGEGELTFNGSGVDAVFDSDPVNKGQFGVVVYDSGKVTVNDGDFTAGWYCLSGNGSKTSADSVTTVNGGTLTSVVDYAIYHPHPGSLIITGGNISGGAGAVAINNGSLTITGGTLTVTGGGNTGEGSGGTSGLGEACINFNARYGDVTCRITGGTFVVAAEEAVLFNIDSTHNVDLKISGGRFNRPLNPEWIETGYVAKLESDGFYEVTKA
jgi:lipopolysaccharide export system protein LptA